MARQEFLIRKDDHDRLLSVSHPDDPYGMNWIAGSTPWGTVRVPEWPLEYKGWGEPEKPYRLDVQVERRFLPSGYYHESYRFINNSGFEIDTLKDDLAIVLPFNDSYESAAECKVRRCYAHVWCAGESSYVMALRMGGEGPNFGMVVTEGGFSGYSIERDASRGSNDRGDFVFHLLPMHFLPGEAHSIEWDLFWFDTEAEFQAVLRSYRNFIAVAANGFVLFEGEELHLTSNGSPSRIDERCLKRGVRRYEFEKNGFHTTASILVLPQFEKLLHERVQFIVKKQQCMNEASRLYGAYLIYDNEEKRQYYSHSYDHNAGRERVGMGVLIARYLRSHADADVMQSFDRYMEYVRNELYDSASGTVYNDYGRNAEWNRLYNYPWIAQLLLESWKLKGEKRDLIDAARVLKAFYAGANGHFYAIGQEPFRIVFELKKIGEYDEAGELEALFRVYADELLKCGTDYPAHEVAYEQSIVQPAANAMMQAWQLFGEDKYLQAAEEHIRLLCLFNGHQPDYHLYETAIRHWDGFWFGKLRLLGDTFPHYWSALSGEAFRMWSEITGEKDFARRGENAMRGTLSLFREDGSASCAMIYPRRVNGRRAHVYDPWANDQDWAMYCYLKWHDGLEQ